MRALSVRQPYAELNLRGEKRWEYRSVPTNVRGRVYIYASKTLADGETFEECGLSAEELPTGVIVGTVKIAGCREVREGFAWRLEHPIRAKRKMNPRNHPQPVWFYPFGER